MERNSQITKQDLDKAVGILNKINGYYQSKVVGQYELGYALIIALITNGHILLESVPGLAKTTAATVITDAVSGAFSRIQCTPDLLPSDIMGTQIYNVNTNTFENKVGPVYSNFVLLDEINRSSAKTQSAMLEAMQEYKITIGGDTYKLPDIFVVIATQNPIEQEGTYELSEAQMDRFLLKVNLEYPNAMEEMEILNRLESGILNERHAAVTLEDVAFLQETCKNVYVDPVIKKYIVDIVQATRITKQLLPEQLSQYVEMGASTRAAIAFMKVAKAVALINGRNYCIPEDVKQMRYQVLRHRIMLSFAALADEVKVETIIDAIMGAVKTP